MTCLRAHSEISQTAISILCGHKVNGLTTPDAAADFGSDDFDAQAAEGDEESKADNTLGPPPFAPLEPVRTGARPLAGTSTRSRPAIFAFHRWSRVLKSGLFGLEMQGPS